MEFKQTFTALSASEIHDEAMRRHDAGWRYVQILAVRTEKGADVIYSYMLDGHLENLVVSDIAFDATLPSITDIYLEAFVCENEIHDLFGITFDGLVIDFNGNFYHLSTEYPMTVMSPEQAARLEKEKKARAAAEAKKKVSSGASDDADMKAKLAAMPPEKAAKVRAAMEAKAAKEKASADAELEAKLAAMPPEKAAKVRAAMEAKAAKEREEK